MIAIMILRRNDWTDEQTLSACSASALHFPYTLRVSYYQEGHTNRAACPRPRRLGAELVLAYCFFPVGQV